MSATEATYVRKSCAYLTRDTGRSELELLVFEGPEHDGLQIPKGTVEPSESPRQALFREVVEESGVGTIGDVRHLVSDIWTRRPGRKYVRHFYQTSVYEPRDRWTHTVTGTGDERGVEYECFWIELPTDREFALALDEYLSLLER